MAIFRVTSRTWVRAAAKASVRYIVHRRERDEKTQTRKLFGKDGEELTKYQAYRMIDKAAGNTTFFRLIISPDRKNEDAKQDLDLKTLTEMTMMQLQDRFPNQNIGYVAAVHTNTDNRHVHILALIQAKRIPKKDLSLLISTTTNEARQQRQVLDRDITQPSTAAPPVRGTRTARKPPQQGAVAVGSMSRKTGVLKKEPRVQLARMGPSCPNCGPGSQMERRGRRFECLSCGLRLKQTGLGIEISQGPGLELALEGVGET